LIETDVIRKAATQ